MYMKLFSAVTAALLGTSLISFSSAFAMSETPSLEEGPRAAEPKDSEHPTCGRGLLRT